MPDNKYDVTIIGSGPGGYVAAIRCAQLGMRTALIEKYSTLGGTCLNVGCIPSKALLDSTEHVQKAKSEFGEHGIKIGNIDIDFKQMIERKRGVVKQTVEGVSFLMKKNKVDVHQGVGSFKDKHTISIKPEKGKAREITTGKVIIATGSKPASLPFIEIDKKRIITSTEALELDKIPKSMVVIGGGIIGVEMGSVYARLGTTVQDWDRHQTVTQSQRSKGYRQTSHGESGRPERQRADFQSRVLPGGGRAETIYARIGSG